MRFGLLWPHRREAASLLGVVRMGYEEVKNSEEIASSLSARLREAGTEAFRAPDKPLPTAQLVTMPLNVGGQQREYQVYVPGTYRPDQPTKVVLAFHGASFGQDAARGLMAKETGFNDKADLSNFVVVYPLAKNRSQAQGAAAVQSWNVPGSGNLSGTDNSYSDIHYVDALLADVKTKLNVDARNISAAGFSDGGRFAQDYARTRPNTLSAFSSIHGTTFGDNMLPSSGTPALIIHSIKTTPSPLNNDLMLPYSGGYGPMTWLTQIFPGGKNSQPALQMNFWRDANNCLSEPEITEDANHKITSYKATTCSDGDVHEILIKNGQHAWDGPTGQGGFAIIGERTNTPISETVLRFLLTHKKPDTPPLYRNFHKFRWD